MISLLHHSIMEGAQNAPEAIAFQFPKQDLTFAQFDEKTNQIANYLIEDGLRPNDRVGIYCQRSLETALAVYGIFKAGAAFVPLNPFAPREAISAVIQHCGIRQLFTHLPMSRHVAMLNPGDIKPLESIIGMRVEDNRLRTIDWNQIWEFDRSCPRVPVKPDDLAYIMYTSGSTGNPKGIMHTHHSGLSYARLSADLYAISPQDCIGGHPPLHFDMSTMAYLTGPYAGAKTLIIPEAYTKLPASLSQLIEQFKITIWYSVPFALNQLLLQGALEKRDLSSLRWVLYGGEPMNRKQIYALMEHMTAASFGNVYGPAEVNQCTFHEIPRPGPISSARDLEAPVSLGRVWPETKALVINENEQPVGVGESGELLVHSSTMMQGYWNQKALNDRVFANFQYDGEALKFYRTGDIVKRTSETDFLFIGRQDRQIKIRGNRVELDEIENILSCHESIEEAAVYKIEIEGVSRLEASIKFRQGCNLEEEEIMAYLAGKFPRYAIPEIINTLTDFPRTGTGKIDRNYLIMKTERSYIQP